MPRGLTLLLAAASGGSTDLRLPAAGASGVPGTVPYSACDLSDLVIEETGGWVSEFLIRDSDSWNPLPAKDR
jgi:hypothetical protein